MTGDFQWVKDEDEADFMFGGESYTITDKDIEKLKKGEILNFFVNLEYGCTLKYEKAYESRNYYIYEQIEKGRSFAEVGREVGVTRERIRQVYLKERRKKENE